MARIPLTVLLSLALLPVLLSAASLDDEMRYFLNSGETHSPREVDVDGVSYSVVLVNGVESLAFNASNGVVADESLLTTIVDAYVKAQMQSQASFDLAQIKADINTTRTDLNASCLPYMTIFNRNRGAGSVPWDISVVAGHVRPIQLAALRGINGSINTINSGYVDLDAAVSDLEAAQGSGDSDVVFDRLSKVNAAVAPIKSSWEQLGDAFNKIHFGVATESAYPNYPRGTSCNVTDAAQAAFARLSGTTTVENPYDKPAIVSRMKSMAAARSTVAAVRRIAGEYKDAMTDAAAAKERAATALASVNIQITLLDAQFATVQSKLGEIEKAATPEAARLRVSDFEAARTEFLTLAGKFETAGVAVDAARKAVASAESAVAAARSKFGKSDSRVTALESQVTAEKKTLVQLEGQLATGDAQAVAGLESEKVRANAMAMEASTLQPPEWQVDPMMIGGAAVLVVLLGVVVVFIIKKRQQEYPKMGAE